MNVLQSIRILAQVVRLGRFTVVSESLNISTTMASKHLSELERRLHIKLLNRTSRKLSLTEAGQHYYQPCVKALEMALADMGIAILPGWSTQNHRCRGELINIFPDSPPSLNPTIYAVYTRRQYLTTKVSTFIDFWVEKMVSHKRQ